MRRPNKHKPNRTPSSMMLAFAHASFEASKWGVRSDDNIKVIMSPQAGVHTARILSRKDAIKAAAKQRLITKGYHEMEAHHKMLYLLCSIVSTPRGMKYRNL